MKYLDRYRVECHEICYIHVPQRMNCKNAFVLKATLKAAEVPDSFHSIVREHTGILQSGDKLRRHNRGSYIPGKEKKLFQMG